MLKELNRPSLRAKAHQEPKTPEIREERIVVTPDIAAAWLDRNLNNRRKAGRHIEKMARDMAAGRWLFSGEAIKFDINERLIDGQHRLEACVKSGAPFETLVIYGLSPEAQTVLDSGKSRSAADVISLDGLHHANHLAAAARLIMEEKSLVGEAPLATNVFSTTEVLAVIQRHKELPSVVNHVAAYKYPRGVSVAQIATICYIGKHLMNAPKIANQFAEVMATGVPFYEGDAAHALRERIVKSQGGIMTYRKKDKWKLMKHAWNLFVVQQPAKLFRIQSEVRILDLNYDLL